MTDYTERFRTLSIPQMQQVLAVCVDYEPVAHDLEPAPCAHCRGTGYVSNHRDSLPCARCAGTGAEPPPGTAGPVAPAAGERAIVVGATWPLANIEAEARPAATQSGGAWVKCSERMPKDAEPVWLFEEGWVVADGYREYDLWFSSEGWVHKGMKPTHWMPRYVQPTPDPPKGDTDG